MSTPLFDLVDLARAGVAGCVLWQDSSGETVRHILALVRERDVIVLSQATVARLLGEADMRSARRDGRMTLTQQELDVLRHLATGRRHDAIAGIEHMSVRSIKRIVSSLEDKFDAHTMFVLAKKAVELGYLS